MTGTVGFQGAPGAFSEAAAVELLGAVPTRGYRSFDDLVAAVGRDEVPLAILPCENTIYGPIARTYDLLGSPPGVHIVDETTHGIEQCLIGLNGATLEMLDLVVSHPVALDQCRAFLDAHPHVRVEAAEDTAGAILQIVERGDGRVAAIGPAFAAERYGALILARSIQDDPKNFTRFFLIARNGTPRRSLGRACIKIGLAHESGSLAVALGKIAARELNLRSLLARPSRRRPFEYDFFLELDAPANLDVRELASTLSAAARVLGHY